MTEPGAARYSLALSESERARYRMMAASAADNESIEWSAAGIRPGARIADVGCGPGAVLRLLAEAVGPEGVADGVDADPGAVAAARAEVANLPQADVRVGQADATGLDPASYDVVMCRLVLAHNGGHESAIVRHLASLTAPGGCVYLVDIDATSFRIVPGDLESLDIMDRYSAFQAARGNDLSIGLRLGDLLTDAGLVVERYASRSPVLRIPPGQRGPAWAARDAMVAEGFATDADVQRWDRVFTELDGREPRPWLFTASFVALGRRPDGRLADSAVG